MTQAVTLGLPKHVVRSACAVAATTGAQSAGMESRARRGL